MNIIKAFLWATLYVSIGLALQLLGAFGLRVFAHAEDITVPREMVYAPAELSGLMPPVEQPWEEHYKACAVGFYQWDGFLNQCIPVQFDFKILTAP